MRTLDDIRRDAEDGYDGEVDRAPGDVRRLLDLLDDARADLSDLRQRLDILAADVVAEKGDPLVTILALVRRLRADLREMRARCAAAIPRWQDGAPPHDAWVWRDTWAALVADRRPVVVYTWHQDGVVMYADPWTDGPRPWVGRSGTSPRWAPVAPPIDDGGEP